MVSRALAEKWITKVKLQWIISTDIFCSATSIAYYFPPKYTVFILNIGKTVKVWVCMLMRSLAVILCGIWQKWIQWNRWKISHSITVIFRYNIQFSFKMKRHRKLHINACAHSSGETMQNLKKKYNIIDSKFLALQLFFMKCFQKTLSYIKFKKQEILYMLT